MLNIGMISRLRKPLLINVILKIINRRDIHIENEMKRLNDRKEFAKVITLFDKYKQQETPTDRSIVQVLKACTQLGDVKHGVNIHKGLSNRSLKDVYIRSTLIHFYMRCGRVNDAEQIFDSSITKTMPDYGAMMKGYLVNNMSKKSIELFSKIKNPDEMIFSLLFANCSQVGTKEALNFGRKVWSEIPLVYHRNKYIRTAALNMFITCGDVLNAKNLFITMKADVISYGQMMKCYNDQNMPMQTISLHKKMKSQGIEGDVITFVLLADACAQIGMKSYCQSIVSQIPHGLLANLQLQTALIHMWGKSGSALEAKRIFEQIDHPNHVTYTAMINSYGLNGMAADAIELYHRMPKNLINEKTHVCVLNACSHSGLINEARSIFEKIPMKNEWIYTTMIDCLSRSFFFDDAQQLIKQFEEEHRPCLPMYMSLLSGVRNAREAKLASEIMALISQLFPGYGKDQTAAAVLLSNTLASSGDLEGSSKVRSNLSQSGAKKIMGLSWTEVNGKLFQFRAQDRSHPQTAEIYKELDRILKELIDHGHQFDASWITRPMMTDETVESILNSHSERIALALNFIQNPFPSEIQITINLRICGDCHAAIKLISRIRKCSIVIRDANRIHHFSDGNCSCLDHF